MNPVSAAHRSFVRFPYDHCNSLQSSGLVVNAGFVRIANAERLNLATFCPGIPRSEFTIAERRRRWYSKSAVEFRFPVLPMDNVNVPAVVAARLFAVVGHSIPSIHLRMIDSTRIADMR